MFFVLVSKVVFDFLFLFIVMMLVVEIIDLVIGYDWLLFVFINLIIWFGENIVIWGFNGIGKFILLKILIGEIEKISGDFYFLDNIKINYFL